MTLIIINQSDQDKANKVLEDAGFGPDTFTSMYEKDNKTFLVACGYFESDEKSDFVNSLKGIAVEIKETSHPVEGLNDLGYTVKSYEPTESDNEPITVE